MDNRIGSGNGVQRVGNLELQKTANKPEYKVPDYPNDSFELTSKDNDKKTTKTFVVTPEMLAAMYGNFTSKIGNAVNKKQTQNDESKNDQTVENIHKLVHNLECGMITTDECLDAIIDMLNEAENLNSQQLGEIKDTIKELSEKTVR